MIHISTIKKNIHILHYSLKTFYIFGFRIIFSLRRIKTINNRVYDQNLLQLYSVFELKRLYSMWENMVLLHVSLCNLFCFFRKYGCIPVRQGVLANKNDGNKIAFRPTLFLILSANNNQDWGMFFPKYIRLCAPRGQLFIWYIALSIYSVLKWRTLQQRIN